MGVKEFALKKKLAKILQQKSVFKNQEFAKYIIPFEENELPLSIRDKHSSYKKFTLEIGCGWGEFTIASAEKNKDEFIVALDKKKKRIIRCAKNQVQKNLKNINWLILDTSWFFREVFEAATFDKVVINFPDPWPKSKHHKHRLISSSFLNDLSFVTSESSQIEFATDYWPFMEEALMIFDKSPIWKNTLDRGCVVHEVRGRPKSYFEELKRAEGENTYFCLLEKSDNRGLAGTLPTPS